MPPHYDTLGPVVNNTNTSPTITGSMQPERVTWSKDPNSAEVTILEANPDDHSDPDKWVLTYDENADILDGGEKGHDPGVCSFQGQS